MQTLCKAALSQSSVSMYQSTKINNLPGTSWLHEQFQTETQHDVPTYPVSCVPKEPCDKNCSANVDINLLPVYWAWVLILGQNKTTKQQNNKTTKQQNNKTKQNSKATIVRERWSPSNSPLTKNPYNSSHVFWPICSLIGRRRGLLYLCHSFLHNDQI